jgi:hypothetical protein
MCATIAAMAVQITTTQIATAMAAEIGDIVSSFTLMILHSVRFVAVFRRCLLTQSLEHCSLYNTASAPAASSGEPQSISSMATVPSRKQAMIARPA